MMNRALDATVTVTTASMTTPCANLAWLANEIGAVVARLPRTVEALLQYFVRRAQGRDVGLIRRSGVSSHRWANRLPRQVRDRAMNGNRFRTFNSTELRGLLNLLQRNDADLRARLAVRVEALGGAGASISDPLYQRQFFAVKSLEAQRAEVESELSRRLLVAENAVIEVHMQGTSWPGIIGAPIHPASAGPCGRFVASRHCTH